MKDKELLIQIGVVIAIIFVCSYIVTGEALAVVNKQEMINEITKENKEQKLPESHSYKRNVMLGYEDDINTYIRSVNGKLSLKTVDDVAIKLALYPSMYNSLMSYEVQNLGFRMYYLAPDDIEGKNELENEIARIGDELYEAYY